MKLQTGQIIMTVGIEQLMFNVDFKRFVDWCLIRHQDADWGNCSQDDEARNNIALEIGSRIISTYNFTPDLTVRQTAGLLKMIPIHPDAKIWIITESSRLTTTMLFPSEY